MSDNARPALRAFSLSDGGPFYRLMVRLGIARKRGGVWGWVVALAAWLPLALGQALRAALGMPADPTVLDLSVHARLLIALPAILFSERLIQMQVRSALNSLCQGGLCDPNRVEPIVARGASLRDAAWPELALLVLALLGGQLALWGVTGSTGLIHGGVELTQWSFPRVWYVAIALPLMQFVMFRWLWRWVIWGYMLARIARLRLAVLATHPDEAGGLACLARPMSGYAAFAFAMGALVAAAWETQVFNRQTTLQAKVVELVAFVLLILAVAVVPLLPFCGHLFRGRRRTLAQYGDFASWHTRAFHAKWIEGQADAARSVGVQDLQSLADLGESYRVVSRTRLFAFGLRSILSICASALLPMTHLLASTVTAEEVLKRIINAILGGFPL